MKSNKTWGESWSLTAFSYLYMTGPIHKDNSNNKKNPLCMASVTVNDN